MIVIGLECWFLITLIELLMSLIQGLMSILADHNNILCIVFMFRVAKFGHSVK